MFASDIEFYLYGWIASPFFALLPENSVKYQNSTNAEPF